MHEYPKWKYHPENSPSLVMSEEEEKALTTGWFDTPAQYGVETCPGVRPDPQIAKRKKTKAA